MAHGGIRNPTAQAIRKRFAGEVAYPMISSLPFSSDRNGSNELEGLELFSSAWRCCWMLKFLRLEKLLNEDLVSWVALSQKNLTITSPQKPSDIQALAFCLRFVPSGGSWNFESSFSGSGLKIISGDNPVTVSSVPKSRFADYHSYACSKITDENCHGWQGDSIWTCLIRKLIPYKLWKKQVLTTAMTGDGVNDIPLALREADCSIVMKETQQLVRLPSGPLNSYFNDVSEILFEGRRVVQ